jgi:N-acyl-D-aspartate/D-glutamate deacylase
LIFDGTGTGPAPADVVIEAGRILDVGPGFDGDEVVDLDGLRDRVRGVWKGETRLV